MAIVDPNNVGRVVDLSSEINIVPNQWGLYNSLGLFATENKTQKQVLIPRTTETEVVLKDKNWDERNNAIAKGERDMLSLVIPHFPVDESITPNDVDGAADWDSVLQGGNNVLSVEKVRMAKMERLRRAHALTLERSRAQLIKDGTVYAPNGTVTTNYYSLFGVNRVSADMGLSSTVVNPMTAFTDVLGTATDAVSSGDVITNWVAICSPEFFGKLAGNPFVVESFSAFAQPQSAGVLNQRLSSGGLDARYRTLEYAGITFIEARGKIDGYNYVEAEDAYLLPLGTDSFRTMFAPANRFASVNKPAQESYYFEYINERDDIIEIMSETNFLNTLLRPQTVVTLQSGD